MKILIVLTYYRPHWTGLTQYAARLAEGLAERGYQVEVLCTQHDRRLPKKEVVNGVAVFRLPYLFRFVRSVVAPQFPLAVWGRIKRNEIVLVYLPFQEAVLVAILAKLLGKKLFLVHNGDLVLPEEGGILNRAIEKIYYLTTRLAISLSNAVIIQTEDYANNSKLLKKYKNKWRIILPLFQVPKIIPKDTSGFIKKNKLENKVLIGFSGRFVGEKGVDFLLQAIPAVKRQIPEAHFVFAGDYKIKYEKFWDKIKDLIQKNSKDITMLGLIKYRKEIFSFYKSLSVYVQPSRTDCFPSSQIEALLSGVPSVCTDIPGARWAVKETRMGEIVKSQDPDSLAKGIFEVLNERGGYIKNYRKVREIFDYRKTLNQYEELFARN